jgi:hypothetical protein
VLFFISPFAGRKITLIAKHFQINKLQGFYEVEISAW